MINQQRSTVKAQLKHKKTSKAKQHEKIQYNEARLQLSKLQAKNKQNINSKRQLTQKTSVAKKHDKIQYNEARLKHIKLQQ